MPSKEDIAYSFFESDRIWPPGLTPAAFKKALLEVLSRLPDEAYDVIEDRVSFVVEDPRIAAVNVPFIRSYPAENTALEVRFDTIVVFHRVLSYPHAALVGLLAHELAHSMVSGKEYHDDEKAADDLAQQWGFGEELEALCATKQAAQSDRKDNEQR